jgi:oligosaccharyltransferase complex subunit alpha (ribophorin I)
VFDDMVADEVTTKIILPEGSQDIHGAAPYSVEHLPTSLHFTYLDTKGRPVVIMRKKNLVENHIQEFEVS